MTTFEYESLIEDIPDYPKPGVVFKDITPLLASAEGFAAVIKGMAEFRKPSHIKGVILNDCSKMMYAQFAPVYEKQTGIPVLGYIPHVEGA